MVWSNYNNNPIDQNTVDDYRDKLPSEIVDEVDYRISNTRSEIESKAKEKYPTPSDAPSQLVNSSSLAGRKIKNDVDEIQDFFFKYKFAPEQSETYYEQTLEYIGIKALKNGN